MIQKFKFLKNLPIRCLITVFSVMVYVGSIAQMGIGIPTPHGSAGLEIQSASKGLLIPRVFLQSTGDNGTITDAEGTILVYNTNPSILQGQGVGFYYNSSTNPLVKKWVKWSTGGNFNEVWSPSGNAGTNSNNHFIGTTDNTPLLFRSNLFWSGLIHPSSRSVFFGKNSLSFNGSGAVAYGFRALWSNSKGHDLVAVGQESLSTLGTNSPAVMDGNTAVGDSASHLSNNVENTTAMGSLSMKENQVSNNTGVGYATMVFMNRPQNTVFGSESMARTTLSSSNTRPVQFNTGFGSLSLNNLFEGGYNTAFGDGSVTGFNADHSTAFGRYALEKAGTIDVSLENAGWYQVGIGFRALAKSNRRQSNTAVGHTAMAVTTLGEENVAVGSEALRSSVNNKNTAVGSGALTNLTTGTQQTSLGAFAGVASADASSSTSVGYLANAIGNYSNVTCIGTSALVSDHSSIRFGNASIVSIGGQVAWTVVSNGKVKMDVRDDVPGLEFVRELHPVTYHFDPMALQQYEETKLMTMQLHDTYFQERHAGLLAQDVLELAKSFSKQGMKDLVREPEGAEGLHGIRYELMVVPLIKTIQEQQAILVSIKKLIEELEKQLKTEDNMQ
jgi:hypothetical protein